MENGSLREREQNSLPLVPIPRHPAPLIPPHAVRHLRVHPARGINAVPHAQEALQRHRKHLCHLLLVDARDQRLLDVAPAVPVQEGDTRAHAQVRDGQRVRKLSEVLDCEGARVQRETNLFEGFAPRGVECAFAGVGFACGGC